MDSLSLILDTFAPDDGPVLDIGCGNGLLARALTRTGIGVFGVDPSREAILVAKRRAPLAQACVAGAERLPFPNGSFGGAIFLNSLHHIPDMRGALLEAARVVRRDAPIVVVEPLTEGSFFRAFLAIEDETAVREAAQHTIETLVGEGAFTRVRRERYERPESFPGLPEFLERAAAADESRRAAIENGRREIERAFLAEADPAPGGGYLLTQPLLGQVLRGG